MVLDKNYDPKKIEPKWAEKWVAEKTYKWKEAESPEKNYLIDAPPPYPYVLLHAGNFMNFTYQDMRARYKRMKGYSVLHPWGWDCHGLPAEIHIQKEYNITAEKIGIKKFKELCKKHLLENIENITKQAKTLGISIDWDKQYITMNPEYMRMVQETFIDMYNKKMVYRANYPVTWCPSCHCSIADDQADKKNRKATFYYIKLPLVEGNHITIATTRPELMGACVAVFVNPKDERYKHLISKKVKIPFTEQIVEILSNEDADPEFGTGAVYHCTFGDRDDWKWIVKYKLPVNVIINDKGIFTEKSKILTGLSIKEGRKKIIEELKKKGLIEKEEEIEQAQKVCERCETPLEILVKDQWYFATTKLKKEILNSADKMRWYPEFAKQRLTEWVKTALWDWVISRQRYWATPFPVWYCDKCNKIIIADKTELPVDPNEKTKNCSCGGTAKPETDVMDTWMDSSVTAIQVSNWLKNKKENKLCDLRTQGEEIIKTWTYYTISRCTAQTSKIPFDEVLVNGMVLGLDGKKMSKRRAKAMVLPEKIIEDYSVDVFRQWVANSNPGEPLPIDKKEMVYANKFLNKLWNISRFIEQFKETNHKDQKNIADQWIINELNQVIKKVTESMQECRWKNALSEIREFSWHVFADYYLEMIKYRLYGEDENAKNSAVRTCRIVLKNCLKMLSPISPFLTEEVYNNMFNKESIHLSKWPEEKKEWEYKGIEELGGLMKKTISELRQYKINNQMSLAKELERVEIQGSLKNLEEIKNVIKGTMRIKELIIKQGKDLKIQVK